HCDWKCRVFIFTPPAFLLEQLTQGRDRLFENPIVNRTEQAATAQGVAFLRNRLSVQWLKISFAVFPNRTEGMIGGGRRGCRKPCDLPVNEKRRPRLFDPQVHQTMRANIECIRLTEVDLVMWDRLRIAVPRQIVNELF